METKQRLGYAPPQIYLVRPEPFLDGSSGYPRGIEVWTAPAPNLPPDAPHGPVNLPTLRAKPPQPVSDATANSTGISKADFEKLMQGEDAMLEDPESAPATAKTPVEPHKTASIDLSQQNSTKKEQNTQAQTGTNATSEQVNTSTTTIPATTTTAVPKAATNPETAPPINGAIDLSQPNSSKTEAKKPESNPQPVPTAKVNKTPAPVVTKKPSKPLIPEQSKEEKKTAPLAITPPVAPPQIPVQIASQAPPAPVIIEKKKDNYWWIIAAAVVGYIVLRKND